MHEYTTTPPKKSGTSLGAIVSVVILTILWHLLLYAIFVDQDEMERCPDCRMMEYRRPAIEDTNYRQYPKRKKFVVDDCVIRSHVIV